MDAIILISQYLDQDRPPIPKHGPMVHLLADKYQKGELADIGTPIPLTGMLYDEWPTDAHFTQYSSPCNRRLLKGVSSAAGIKFEIAAFDLDFGNHTTRPTLDDFANLARACWLLDQPPNWVYETRGGARLVYEIDPIHSPDEFEGHYQSLTRVIHRDIGTDCGYMVDLAVRDWTRLFRAPRVVRDGRADYDRYVGHMEDGQLDLRKFKRVIKSKPKPPSHSKDFTPHDHYLIGLMMHVGKRNTDLFKAACHILRTYKPAASEQWLFHLANKASEAGLDEREIETTINSAKKTVGA